MSTPHPIGEPGRARFLCWLPVSTLFLDPSIPYHVEPVEVLTKVLQRFEQARNPVLDVTVAMRGVYLRDPFAGGALRLFFRPELTERGREIVQAVGAGDGDLSGVDWMKGHGGSGCVDVEAPGEAPAEVAPILPRGVGDLSLLEVLELCERELVALSNCTVTDRPDLPLTGETSWVTNFHPVLVAIARAKQKLSAPDAQSEASHG